MKNPYTLADLRQWLEQPDSQPSPAPRLAVIGNPIGHSLSPQLHQPALDAAARECSYINLEVPVGAVEESFQLMEQLGFIGANITVPHKLEALEVLKSLGQERVSEHAQQLGAINTLHFSAQGWRGYNTDGPGLLAALEEAFQLDAQALSQTPALLLGAAGGAGRAASIQLALAGCPQLTLANRTVAKAEQLAKDIQSLFQAQGKTPPQLHAVSLEAGQLAPHAATAKLLIHSTSLGRKEGEALPIPADQLRPEHCLLDMVYRRGEPTPLVHAAKSAGAQAVDGLTLLLHQGVFAQEHWFGEKPELEIMREGLGLSTQIP